VICVKEKKRSVERGSYILTTAHVQFELQTPHTSLLLERSLSKLKRGTWNCERHRCFAQQFSIF
jgi:hypothetical protein